MHLHDGKNMPTPSDIINLMINTRPMADYKPPEGRKHYPTDGEIKNVETILDEIRGNMTDEKVSANEMKEDYTHFNRMPEEERDRTIRGLRNIVKH